MSSWAMILCHTGQVEPPMNPPRRPWFQIHLSTSIGCVIAALALGLLVACGNPAPSVGPPWTTGSYLSMIAKACFRYAQDNGNGSFPDDPVKQLVPKYLSTTKSFSPATLLPGATLLYVPGFGEKDDS